MRVTQLLATQSVHLAHQLPTAHATQATATSDTPVVVCGCALPPRPGQDFSGAKWSRSAGAWKPVTLRLAAFGMEALEPGGGGAGDRGHERGLG